MNKILENIVNSLDQAIILFENGSLNYCNIKTEGMLSKLQVEEMFFSLDELNSILDLPPMQGNTSETRTIIRNQHTVNVTRADIGSGWVQFSMRDMTPEIRHARQFEAMTTELLVQVRSKITNAQNALVLYRNYKDSLSASECDMLSAGACFELWQLERTLDNIRDVNAIRIHTADAAFDIGPCDSERILKDAIQVIYDNRPDPNRPMDVSIATDAKIPVLADPIRLCRILQCMVLNAHLYSHPKSAIQVKITEEPHNIRFTVENDGVEIHPEDIPYIFTHGFRGRNALSLPFSGNGFDLSYSLNLAMRMHGRMEFESGSGKTTFHLDLPRADNRDHLP